MSYIKLSFQFLCLVSSYTFKDNLVFENYVLWKFLTFWGALRQILKVSEDFFLNVPLFCNSYGDWHQWWPKPGKQGTNETERILVNLDKTERTGQNGQNWAKPGKNGQKTGIFTQKRGKQGKKQAKSGKTGQKNWQKRSKNGRTKPNPGPTGRNRKFRRILVWVWSSLVTILIDHLNVYASKCGSLKYTIKEIILKVWHNQDNPSKRQFMWFMNHT